MSSLFILHGHMSFDCLFCNYAWASSEIKVLKSIFIVNLNFVPILATVCQQETSMINSKHEFVVMRILHAC